MHSSGKVPPPSATQEISCIYVCTIVSINFCINIIIFLSLHKKNTHKNFFEFSGKVSSQATVTVQGVMKSSFAWVEIAKQECALWPIIDTLSGMGSR